MEVFNQLKPFLNRQREKFKIEITPRNLINRLKYRNDLLGMKNKHSGERCFIIGNGPSLTAEDLTLLKEEYTFASNRIFYIFPKTTWRPTYYCGQDYVVIEDIADKLESFVGDCKKVFISSRCWDVIPENVRRKPNICFFFPRFKGVHKEDIFSDQIENFVSDGGTVTYAAIQLAVYMGFSKIYLLGCDHNYSSASFQDNSINNKEVANNYFEGMPTDIKLTKPRTDNSTLSFIKAKEYCDAHGIAIYNATRGGKLEVFKRVKLEDVV